MSLKKPVSLNHTKNKLSIMKKLSLISFVVLFAVATMPSYATQTVNVKNTNMFAGKNDPHSKKDHKKIQKEEVSQLSKDHFLRDFGNIKSVAWERTPDFDQATFKKNGKEMMAYYDDQSNLVGTTTAVKFAVLPKDAQKEINDKYKDYKVGAVIYFKDNELNDTNMILYGSEFEDADNYFVELNSPKENIVLEVSPDGAVSYFKKI